MTSRQRGNLPTRSLSSPTSTTFMTMNSMLAVMASPEYGSYKVTDWLSVVGRAEVWRDNSGFFVGAFPGKFHFVNSEYGFVNTSFFAPPTTYLESTAGLNISPAFSMGPRLISDHPARGSLRYIVKWHDAL